MKRCLTCGEEKLETVEVWGGVRCKPCQAEAERATDQARAYGNWWAKASQMVQNPTKRRGVSGKAPRLFTIEEYVAHVEARWLSGMSWANYGVAPGCWHNDHIRPVASFASAIVGDAQWVACYSLSNLQPLWARANEAKGDRIILADGSRAPRESPAVVYVLPPGCSPAQARAVLDAALKPKLEVTS